jgi:hypothetical protein
MDSDPANLPGRGVRRAMTPLRPGSEPGCELAGRFWALARQAFRDQPAHSVVSAPPTPGAKPEQGCVVSRRPGETCFGHVGRGQGPGDPCRY